MTEIYNKHVVIVIYFLLNVLVS